MFFYSLYGLLQVGASSNDAIRQVDSNLTENQFGFRRRKGTHEAIRTSLKLIIERRLEINKDTYIPFIYREKAFGSVIWDKLFQVLR